VKGLGNQQDYGMRIYDPRIGRFLSVDPLTKSYPELTPYQFASNTPIGGIDLDGEEVKIVTVYHGLHNDAVLKVTNYDALGVLGVKPILTTTIHNYIVIDAHGHNQSYTDLSPILHKEIKEESLKPANTPGSFNLNDAKVGLKAVLKDYGVDIATHIEQMYRSETRSFTSGQYVKTGTAGMESFGSPPNYGWNGKYWREHPEYAPLGLTAMKENKGLEGGNKQVTDKPKQYMIFPSVEAGMRYQADYIVRYGGDFAMWHNRFDSTIRNNYRKAVLKFTPEIIRQFTRDSLSQTH